ncbi:MAG: M48 family metallopeptidase [Chthoniobacterales bacterium]
MDFFEHQTRARRKTGWLILYFVLAILGIIAALQVALAFATGVPFLDLELLGLISAGVLLIVTAGSLFKFFELSRGGGVVAEMLGGSLVGPQTTDLREIQLRNVVEEMSIASGVPVPDVYVLGGENGINAFAAGNGPGDAVVAVTRGTLNSLTRDELQGVIAHEFSHILNGDMRMNLRLIGALNGILLLAILGRILLRTGFWTGGRVRTNRENGNGQIPIVAVGLVLLIVGSIGLLFAKMIKAAVSRQREFLADASAVQFTRNPDGIAGALFKIGRASSLLATPRADEASHLFFGNGVGGAFAGMFATHPPIDERIAAVAPNFDAATVGRDEARRPVELPTSSPRPWTDAAGSLTARNIALAAAGLTMLPTFAKGATRESASAVSLVYAFLLSDDKSTRAAQLESLGGPEVRRRQVLVDFARRSEIPRESWLSVIDLCFPALRHLSPDQYRTFRSEVRRLTDADGKVELFEYVLQKALVRHLDCYYGKTNEPVERYRSVIPLLPDLVTVMLALAWFDSENPAQRQESFAAGVDSLNLTPDAYPPQSVEAVRLDAVDRALDRLAQANGPTKRKILVACGRVVTADERIEPRQGALLRAVADTLGCPIPPFATEPAVESA